MKIEQGYKNRDKNIQFLKEVARKLGKRINSLNLTDSQVNRFPIDWRDALSNKPGTPDFFTRKLSYKVDNLQVTLRVNDEYLVADIKGPFGDDIVCSFVHNMVSDASRKVADKLLCEAYGHKIFLSSYHETDSMIQLHQNLFFQQLVKKLRLSTKESLHIGYGYATLYLQRFSWEEVSTTLATLYELLALLSLKQEETPSLEGLPENFHKLIPLINRWSITDDNDRSEKVNKASSNTLTRLVYSVKPYFSAINDYLDTFGEMPLSEHARLLGALAECATEAQLILKERAKRRKTITKSRSKT